VSKSFYVNLSDFKQKRGHKTDIRYSDKDSRLKIKDMKKILSRGLDNYLNLIILNSGHVPDRLS